MTENEELNRKLTEWADAKEYFTDEDGCRWRKLIRFTESLDACFKWLVPKLIELGDVGFVKWDGQRDKNQYTIFMNGSRFTDTDTPALALCLAIEKLIDKEK